MTLNLGILSVIGLLFTSMLQANTGIPAPRIFSVDYEKNKEMNFSCENHKTQAPFLRCLEDMANDSLLSDSKIYSTSFGNAYDTMREELGKLVFGSNIPNESLDTLALNEVFRYEIPKPENLEIENQCFTDVLGSAMDNEQEKRNFSNNFKNQIKEINQFLIKFHTRSFGQVRSLIFQMSAIKLCDFENFNERLVFKRMGDLKIGIDTDDILDTNYKPLRGFEINRKWGNADAIRYAEKRWFMDGFLWEAPIIGSILKLKRFNELKDQGTPEGIIFDILAKYWMALNPVGDLRLKARKSIKKLFVLLEKENAKATMKDCNTETCNTRQHREIWRKMDNTMSGIGFNEEHFELLESLKDPSIENQKLLAKLYKKWRKEILNPFNLLRSMESSLLNTPVTDQPETSVIAIMDRTMNCFVSVANNHTINIAVENLIRISSYPPISQFGKEDDSKPLVDTNNSHKTSAYTRLKRKDTELESTTSVQYNENTDETNAFVCVNTSDIINVNLKVPLVDKDKIKKLNLYLVFEDHLEGLHIGNAN